MSEARQVEPGTPLAYSEELLPGDGTYDDGEQIRAARFGTEHVDPKTMNVSVVPYGHRVAQIRKGDIVVGQISYIKKDLASVRILEVRGKEGRSVLQQVEGTLHVSKVDNKYIGDLAEEFATGDIIRAKVLSLKGGPQLATDKPEFGVIRAHSPDDPTLPLIRDGDRLMDPETARSYHRKLADDYGSGSA